MEHQHASSHDYAFVILWVVVIVQTEHSPHEKGCRTQTTYRFFYQGILGWILARLAKLATKKNYEILMREDLPMRWQRGRLRRKGCRFTHDRQDLIGFTDTTDISQANVDARAMPVPSRSFEFQISSPRGSRELEEILIRI
ncbi:MAG: hypothetical protein V2I51_19435, partial [Anderseniella sp.]|nr:hypothetical protein [Anderseniella sp.]